MKKSVKILIGIIIIILIAITITYFVFFRKNDINKQKIELVWIGNDTFKINASKIIYINPQDQNETADFALFSDYRIWYYKMNYSSGKEIKESLKLSSKSNINVNGINILVYPTSKVGEASFLFGLNGIIFFYAGNTKFFSQMGELTTKNIDYAILKIGGKSETTVEQSIKIAKTIIPKNLIIAYEGSGLNEEDYSKLLNDNNIKVIILKENQTAKSDKIIRNPCPKIKGFFSWESGYFERRIKFNNTFKEYHGPNCVYSNNKTMLFYSYIVFDNEIEAESFIKEMTPSDIIKISEIDIYVFLDADNKYSAKWKKGTSGFYFSSTNSEEELKKYTKGL